MALVLPDPLKSSRGDTRTRNKELSEPCSAKLPGPAAVGSQRAKGSMREVRLELRGGAEHGQRAEKSGRRGVKDRKVGSGEGGMVCSNTAGSA